VVRQDRGIRRKPSAGERQDSLLENSIRGPSKTIGFGRTTAIIGCRACAGNQSGPCGLAASRNSPLALNLFVGSDRCRQDRGLHAIGAFPGCGVNPFSTVGIYGAAIRSPRLIVAAGICWLSIKGGLLTGLHRSAILISLAGSTKSMKGHGPVQHPVAGEMDYGKADRRQWQTASTSANVI